MGSCGASKCVVRARRGSVGYAENTGRPEPTGARGRGDPAADMRRIDRRALPRRVVPRGLAGPPGLVERGLPISRRGWRWPVAAAAGRCQTSARAAAAVTGRSPCRAPACGRDAAATARRGRASAGSQCQSTASPAGAAPRRTGTAGSATRRRGIARACDVAARVGEDRRRRRSGAARRDAAGDRSGRGGRADVCA